ncbi:phosphohydrolase [Kribbella sp. NBC_01484]|uniref:phosphohydrolase n=1 Tax=Kribbella sp. NBC_01484 TaxID=2903579 RepID=UPI002E321FD8|nr:phosphohydrolase [Kribbella sp. NBC_01484]
MTARTVNPALGRESDLLKDAASLHAGRIGYASQVTETGLHPLDGARYLRRSGFNDRVSRLVAHHSGAAFEAEERGLRELLLSEFEPDDSAVADLLWLCDMTVGLLGQDLSIEDRLIEITSRYGLDHVVSRSIDHARQDILSAAKRATDYLERHRPK